MSGFSRSLRSPSYLSARRRPAMPGRTVSGSSDRSMTSDGGAELLASGPTTPLPAYQRRYASSHHQSAHLATADSAPAVPTAAAAAREYFGSGSARPMAIEIPRVSRTNSSSVQTPPEPLSARGDLPGGYFPMHEDPNSRIHRPHPFHPQNRAATVQNHALGDGELLREIEHITSVPQISTTSPTNGNMSTTHANIPVASYFPSGYSDSSLPMGKYYPSNYESRKAAKSKSKKNKKRTASTSSADADAEHTSPEGPLSPTVVNAIESRRRLQQYQRDMMAQASMRAYELLAGSSVKGKGSSKHANLQGLKGLPPNSLSLGPSALRKPNSPRLHPLGSPGPVTPMELESDGVDGNYLNRGSAATSAHHPLENGYDAHST